VLVFSKSTDPDCDSARKLLHELEQYATVVELDLLEEGPQIMEVLKEITERDEVPTVYIKGQLIGGNAELQALQTEGKLEELLE
jgi:glutaredoxin 3